MLGGRVTPAVLDAVFRFRQNRITLQRSRGRVLNLLSPKFPLIHYEHHRRREEIPPQHQGKEILGCVRDPCNYYVSCYRYVEGSRVVLGWFRTYREVHEEQYRIDRSEATGKRRRDFQKPSFNEFLYFFNGAFLKRFSFEQCGVRLQSTIGMLTFGHILFFHKSPVAVLSKDDAALESYFRSGEYKRDMYPVTFLKTENLNQGLYDFLVRKTGLGDDVLSSVLFHKKRNRSDKRGGDELYWTKENTDYVKGIDRFYYRYFYRLGA